MIILIVILFVGGVLDFTLNWGKIHKGVAIEGIDVGGLTVEEASTLITESLTPAVTDSDVIMYASAYAAGVDGHTDLKNHIQKGDKDKYDSMPSASSDEKWELTQGTLGTYIDGEALAQEAYDIGRTGWTFIFDRMLATLGLRDMRAKLSFGSELYQTFIADITEKIGIPLVENNVSIDSGTASLAQGQDGWLLNDELFEEYLSNVIYRTPEQPYFCAPMGTVEVHISTDTAQAVATQINLSLAQPVKVTYESDVWNMDAATLGSLVQTQILEPDQILNIGWGTEEVVEASEEDEPVYDVSTGTDDESGWILQAYVNQEAADAYLISILGDKAVSGAQNAYFEVVDGEISIVESVTGVGPDRPAATLKLQQILFGELTSDRSVSLVDTEHEPDFTTEEAQALGISDKLGSWSVSLGGSSARMHNIALLCEMIDNSIVAPGATWSFNGTTGERTEAKGFEAAPVIVGGKHEDQLGGGACQVATCVYNAACYAGLGIGTRANHDFYISAYDDTGFADATVSWEEPDLQFVNDTGEYLVLLADFDGSETVTVSLWGTYDGRTVTCERGEWEAGAAYKTVRQNDDTLPVGTEKVEQSGQDGRSITIRYLCKSATGAVLHDIKFRSVYSAQNEIILVGTKQS